MMIRFLILLLKLKISTVYYFTEEHQLCRANYLLYITKKTSAISYIVTLHEVNVNHLPLRWSLK